MAEATCAHIEAITTVKHAKRRECDECVKTGSPWVHLRICQECGTTRCCDDSPNRHASRHAQATGHPVWCENSAEDGSPKIGVSTPSMELVPPESLPNMRLQEGLSYGLALEGISAAQVAWLNAHKAKG